MTQHNHPHKDKGNNHEESQKEKTTSVPDEKESTSDLNSLQSELTKLQKEIEMVRKESEEHYQKLLRAMADYQNLKKQAENDRLHYVKFATSGVIASVLPIFDDIERAISNAPENISSTEWFKGIKFIQQSFLKLLEKEGIERIESIGKCFDPQFHEALLYQASEDIEEGYIISEVRTGYMIGEKVLRHAQVIVSKGQEKANSSSASCSCSETC